MRMMPLMLRVPPAKLWVLLNPMISMLVRLHPMISSVTLVDSRRLYLRGQRSKMIEGDTTPVKIQHDQQDHSVRDQKDVGNFPDHAGKDFHHHDHHPTSFVEVTPGSTNDGDQNSNSDQHDKDRKDRVQNSHQRDRDRQDGNPNGNSDPKANLNDPNFDPKANSNVPNVDPSANPSHPRAKPTDPTSNPSDPSSNSNDPNSNPGGPNSNSNDPNSNPGDPNSNSNDPNSNPGDSNSNPSDPNADPSAKTTPQGPTKAKKKDDNSCCGEDDSKVEGPPTLNKSQSDKSQTHGHSDIESEVHHETDKTDVDASKSMNQMQVEASDVSSESSSSSDGGPNETHDRGFGSGGFGRRGHDLHRDNREKRMLERDEEMKRKMFMEEEAMRSGKKMRNNRSGAGPMRNLALPIQMLTPPPGQMGTPRPFDRMGMGKPTMPDTPAGKSRQNRMASNPVYPQAAASDRMSPNLIMSNKSGVDFAESKEKPVMDLIYSAITMATSVVFTYCGVKLVFDLWRKLGMQNRIPSWVPFLGSSITSGDDTSSPSTGDETSLQRLANVVRRQTLPRLSVAPAAIELPDSETVRGLLGLLQHAQEDRMVLDMDRMRMEMDKELNGGTPAELEGPPGREGGQSHPGQGPDKELAANVKDSVSGTVDSGLPSPGSSEDIHRNDEIIPYAYNTDATDVALDKCRDGLSKLEALIPATLEETMSAKQFHGGESLTLDFSSGKLQYDQILPEFIKRVNEFDQIFANVILPQAVVINRQKHGAGISPKTGHHLNDKVASVFAKMNSLVSKIKRHVKAMVKRVETEAEKGAEGQSQHERRQHGGQEMDAEHTEENELQEANREKLITDVHYYLAETEHRVAEAKSLVTKDFSGSGIGKDANPLNNLYIVAKAIFEHYLTAIEEEKTPEAKNGPKYDMRATRALILRALPMIRDSVLEGLKEIILIKSQDPSEITDVTPHPEEIDGSHEANFTNARVEMQKLIQNHVKACDTRRDHLLKEKRDAVPDPAVDKPKSSSVFGWFNFSGRHGKGSSVSLPLDKDLPLGDMLIRLKRFLERFDDTLRNFTNAEPLVMEKLRRLAEKAK